MIPEIKTSSHFDFIDHPQLDDIVNRYGSPCFIVNETLLLKRAEEFKTAIQQEYNNSVAAYSVKTQPTAGIIRRLVKLGFVPEVVSSDEFALINYLKLTENSIIFNGPYKTDAALHDAILAQALINCDHLDEIYRVAALASSLNCVVKIGIRVADNTQGNNWLRFGFPIEAAPQQTSALEAIAIIHTLPSLKFSGLHCHIGTNIRDLSRFGHMATQLALLAETILQTYHSVLDWIDLGGGLAGISPRWDEEQQQAFPPMDLTAYAQAIIKPLKAYLNKTGQHTQLFFEPGRTLIDLTMALITTVVGRRDPIADVEQVLIVDSGIHTIPTTRVYRHPLSAFPRHLTTSVQHSLLLGPSCMQHDTHSEGHLLLPSLEVGDRLLIEGIGAYNTSRNAAFIHLKPAIVLLKQQGGYDLLRPKETIADIQGIL